MNSEQQLVAQARDIHANAMNCSDLASEGAWVAHEDVVDPPLHNYWNVTATRTPSRHGVAPYSVSKAYTREPGVAFLLTFVSTALPQLCDIVDRLSTELADAKASLAIVRQSLVEQADARGDPTMPLLTAEVLERLQGDAEAAYACSDSREDRVAAHGLSLLCDWQERARALAAAKPQR